MGYEGKAGMRRLIDFYQNTIFRAWISIVPSPLAATDAETMTFICCRACSGTSSWNIRTGGGVRRI
jgi:hypothetical protein